MKILFKFSTIFFLLVILIGLVLFFAIGHSVYSGKGSNLTFINASDFQIAKVTVSVSGKFCSAKELGVGGELNCRFQDLYDDGYAVAVTTRGGKEYSNDSMGYVTGGINFTDTITFKKNGSFELKSDIDT